MTNRMTAVLIQDGEVFVNPSYPVPALDPSEVLVKVHYAGLCGSDVQKIRDVSALKVNLLGHEFIGTVVGGVGKEACQLIGASVAAIPLLACGECTACQAGQIHLCSSGEAIGRTRPGAFAEYVTLPVGNVRPIPDLNPAYALADCVAVCLHAMNKCQADSWKGKHCLVLGDGAIGCLQAFLLQESGANVTLVARHPHIQTLLSPMLHHVTLQAEELETNSYDYVFESVGREQADTISSAVRTVKPQGKIVVLGVFPENYQAPVYLRRLFIKEAELIGSNSYVWEEFEEALKCCARSQKTFNTLITNIFPLTEFQKGLELLSAPGQKPIKVLYKCEEGA